MCCLFSIDIGIKIEIEICIKIIARSKLQNMSDREIRHIPTLVTNKQIAPPGSLIDVYLKVATQVDSNENTIHQIFIRNISGTNILVIFIGHKSHSAVIQSE